ncbi:MFS transporter [Kribbella turkmenica]|uniref:Putative proline/betaine transporter n=1 Tax=Kribbella turkmenica TaxID=2530375 RepID=A0A4R4XH92_9ACTN|nr:MFS transporter [Kribbella turkmenica]TDD30009.1 MFS transporter [Kribbella turkmenica]
MAAESQTTANQSRRVVAASGVGNFVEWFDFVIYGFSATVLATHFFPAGNRTTALMATLAVYGVAFFFRPLGGAFFGSIGDRIGRRNTLAIVILVMASATAAIGLLPSYNQIGILAPTLLIIARLAQGFSAGGEFTGVATFVAEHVSANRRGLWVSGVSMFSLVGAGAAALTILALATAFPDEYAAWAWRVPFLIGGLVALVGLYLRLRLDETPVFRDLKARREVKQSPLRAAFRHYPGQLLLIFCVFAYTGLAAHSILGYLPIYLTETVGLPRRTALIAAGVALLVGAMLGAAAGRISDSVGRKPVITVAATLGVILTIPAFLVVDVGGGLTGALAGQLLLVGPYAMLAGVMMPAIMELFPAAVRYAGSAVGYNAAYMVFGGTAPLVGAALVEWSGAHIAPAVYITAIAAIALVAILVALPETREQPAAERTSSGRLAAPESDPA